MSQLPAKSDVIATLLARSQLAGDKGKALDPQMLASLAHTLDMKAGTVLIALMQLHDVKAEVLAKRIGIDAMQVSRLRRSLIPVTRRNAALLGRFFGTGARFWLDLQASDDVVDIEGDAALQMDLQAIVPITERPAE